MDWFPSPPSTSSTGWAVSHLMLTDRDLSTTADLYAHLTPTTQRRLAERMDSILAG